MATKKQPSKKAEVPKVIKGYKGFDKDLKCRNKQYELNKEFTEEDAKICEHGIHFCENPLDIFSYYSPATSRFAEVEGSGKTDRKEGKNEDTKVSCTHLKIGAEISLHNIIESGIKFIFERTTKTKVKHNAVDKKQSSNSGYKGASSNSGSYGASSNSGYKGASSNSGSYGASSNSGENGASSNSGENGASSNSGSYGASSNSGSYGASSNSGENGASSNSGENGASSNSGSYGASSNSGSYGASSNSGENGAAFTIGNDSTAATDAKNSVAVAVGYQNRAKGNVGSWIVLAERNDEYEILSVQSVKVDGKKIKADTFYSLIKGKFVADKN